MTVTGILSIVLFTLFLPPDAAKPAKPAKRAAVTAVSWMDINYARFDVMYEEGVLLSCGYKALKDKESFEVAEQDKLKVTVTRKPGGNVQIELFMSDKSGLEQVDDRMVKEVFQKAIDTCYDKLSD